MAPRTVFILVHGSWFSSSSWERVAHRLVTAGCGVVARDRPAFGLNARFPISFVRRPFDPDAFSREPSPLATVSLDTEVAAVVAQACAVRESGADRVVLVGHSSAGIAVTRVAEERPDLVDHIVYLAAFMPSVGTTGLADLQSEDNDRLATLGPLFVGDPAEIGAIRIDWRSADSRYIAGLHFGFSADGSPSEFLALSAQCSPDDPFSPYLEPTVRTRQRWGAVPRSFVRTTRDAAIRPALFDRWIAEADAVTPGNPTRVYSIDASHCAPVTQPEGVARILLGLTEN